MLLTKSDAERAATTYLGSAAASASFLHAVRAVHVGAFAARPATLRALLQRFQHQNVLERDQVQLYRALCLELCTVAPDARDAATSRGDRYRVAARLCAAVLFGNFDGVQHDGPADTSDQFVDTYRCDGTEFVDHSLVRVAALDLSRAALSTGLFASVGAGVTADGDPVAMAPQRLFAEFLAAEWVVAQDMALPQILSLLQDSADGARRVIPQLKQVAAWLAVMDSRVLEELGARDPELLLASTVVDLPVRHRPTLVRALLAHPGGDTIERATPNATLAYERLAHDGLEQQLREVLEDAARSAAERRIALDIARACAVVGLASAAVDLTLDERQPYHVRTCAAMLVAETADASAQRRLMPVVRDADFDDTEELRGAALFVSWSHFSASELFPLLTRPRRPNWSGNYQIALRDIAAKLPRGHVSSAMTWLASRRARTESSAMAELVESILVSAIRASDDDTIRQPLVRHIRKLLDHHLPLTPSEFAESAPTVVAAIREIGPARLSIVADLFATADLRAATGDSRDATDHRTDAPSDGVSILPYRMPELLSSDDTPWALDQLAALPASSAQRPSWRLAIRWLFNPTAPGHLEAALRHRHDADIATATFDWSQHETLEAARSALSTATAEAQAAEDARNRERAAAAAADAARTPPPVDHRLREILNANVVTSADDNVEASAGEPPESPSSVPHWSTWARLFFALVLDDATGASFAPVPSLDTVHAVQRTLSVMERRGLVDAALRYLNTEAPEMDPFPASGGLGWQSLHGGAAALLLALEAPARFDEIDGGAWTRWMLTLVRYATYQAQVDDRYAAELFRAANRQCATTLTQTLIDALTQSYVDRRRPLSAAIERAALAMLPVASGLVQRAREGAFGTVATAQLLSRLLQLDASIATVAREAACDVLLAPDADVGDRVRVEPTWAVAMAAALVTDAHDSGWSYFESMLQDEPTFARSVFLCAAEHLRYVQTGGVSGSARKLSALYGLLQRAFPPEADVWHTDVYSPGAVDNAVRWRYQTLQVLKRRANAVNRLPKVPRNDF